MTGCLLDTHVLIALLHPERRTVVLPRLRPHRPGEAVTSAIAAHELYFNAAKSERPEENRRRFDRLFQDLLPLPFEQDDARVAGEIRAALKAAGTPIGSYDVLIAGQAKARRLALVSNNARESQRIDGLRVVDRLAG